MSYRRISDSEYRAEDRTAARRVGLVQQLQETRQIRLASITLADLWTAVDDLGIDPATVEFHDGYAMVVRHA